MEVTLKGNSDQIHRIAFDEDDYTLIIQSQGATDEFAEVWQEDPTEETIKTNYELSEFIVLIESDSLLNFEAYTELVNTQFSEEVLENIPVGENEKYGCVFVFDPHLEAKATIDVLQYYITSVSQPYGFYDGSFDNDSTGYEYYSTINGAEMPTNLFFRVADCSTFACFKMVGNSFRLLIGEHDETPANYELKVFKKVLVEAN